MKPYIFAYNLGSESAKLLAEALHTKIIKHENSKYKAYRNHCIINWGANRINNDEVLKCPVINEYQKVRIATNKLDAFQVLFEHGVLIPEFTIKRDTAKQWVEEGFTVFARTILNGHGGDGIEIVENNGDGYLPDAPLYTKYIPKKDEYRVHVLDGQVIDIQKKVRAPGAGDGQFKIRNHDNGFVFARNVNDKPVWELVQGEVTAEAIKAVKALQLDFGGVDVIYNQRQKKAFILEVNTAPGIEGETVNSYEKAFRKYLDWRG